ncbi:hypothetical protein RI129_003866 [Pyrocoelia pectoralis]|uniref:PNPLA domain-containing protein n=1 Tax=Pyrocoelia pectoralis TaxID=417401 RepID=A0AAN7VS74_9COLE
MSLTQWKVLNSLRVYVAKFSNNKKLQNVIHKEITQLLQKLQPSVYGSDIRFIETDNVPAVTEENKRTPTVLEPKSDTGYTLPNVLQGLRSKKVSSEAETKVITPKWKTSTTVSSKLVILAKANKLMVSVAIAQSDDSKIHRIEELLTHIKQFPEVKRQIIKDGVYRVLLRVQRHSNNVNVQAVINEAFALLGYCKPLPGYGIRILSIDGGGTRGLLVIEMLRKLEELTGKRIYELFDYICGVSTGAIIACSVGVFRRDLDVLTSLYREISNEVFNQSAIWGTGNLMWSHSYYDTALWEKNLKEYFGQIELIQSARDPKCPKSTVTPYVFRNYSLPYKFQSQYMGGYNHKVWEAVRASAAAPTYFEECKLGNLLHQDGGILVNNPTAVAIHEAKQIWPNYPIQCVVSFGTGRTVPSHLDINEVPTSNTVHTMLNDLLPGNVYYRFNPYLTEMLSMSEINPTKLEQLERDALMYLRRNEDKFQHATKVLCATKGPAQKMMDWINSKGETIMSIIK